jgi:hypothetical protein
MVQLRSLTGVNFQPDWVWIKRRGAASHTLYDVVRGTTKELLQPILLVQEV